MAHLPGLRGPASFDTKLDQALDQVLSSATGGATTWTGDIKTWSNGQVAIGVLGLPDPATAPAGTPPSLVVGWASRTERLSRSGSPRMSRGRHSVPPRSTPAPPSPASAQPRLPSRTSTCLISPSVRGHQDIARRARGHHPQPCRRPGFPGRRGEHGVAQPGRVLHHDRRASSRSSQQQLVDTVGRCGAASRSWTTCLPWVGGYAQVVSDHLTLGVSTQLADGGTVPSVRETDLAAHFPAGHARCTSRRATLARRSMALLAQLKIQLAADSSNTR